MLAKFIAKIFPRQLRQQLALLTSLVLLLTIFVFAWHSADEQSAAAQIRAELEVVALAQNIAVSSSDAIIIKDFAGIESLLVRMVGLPNIREARITDARGRLLSHVVRKPGAKPEVRFGSRPIDTPAAENAATRIDYSQPASGWRYQLGLGDPGRMVVWQPIFSGILLGWVVVDHDLASTAEIRKLIWNDSLEAGAIASIVSILLLLLFLKRPIGALQTATDFAARLDESHGDQLPVFHGTSEIESLGLALNRAATRLFSQSTDLNNQKFALLARTADLLAGEKYLRTILDAALDAVITMNDKGLVTDWNPEAERIFGYSRADAVGKLLESLIIPTPMREAHRRGLEHFLKTGEGPVLRKRIEVTARRAGGGEFPIEMAIVAIRSGDAVFFNTFLRDITERKRIEEDILQLNTQLSQFKNTLDQALEAVFIFDPDTLLFTYVNKGAMKQTGYGETELMQMTAVYIKPGFTLDKFRQTIQPLVDGVLPSLTFQTVHRHKDGHDVPVEVFLQLIRLEGQDPRFVGMVNDISERQTAQKRIEFLAYHDALTGLPNRLLAKDHMEQAIHLAERENSKVALFFIDLDKFKTINDSLGHAIGDGLLKGVSIRLRECLRDIDTLSRQGGDEFLIVLNNARDTESVAVVAEKILGRMAKPFVINDHELSISLSIGIAVYPDDGKDFDTLLKQSDTAMYQAKESGRNTHRFHTEKMNFDAIEHLRMRNGLRQALEHGEFVLHYQPQISLATDAVIGAEALIRWHHPELGMVPPGRFISIAEDSGLIVPIGEWVLREACRQAVAWHKAGLPELLIAVNLSAVQFKRGDVEKGVTQALAESGMNPALLELELTESILIEDTEKVLATVRRLKSLGVKLSIDDFGTGYSSLSYLKRFNVDKLKIDQSFVRDMVDNPNDAAIVSAIIQMAKNLNLTTVAEGVEDERQLALLRLQHCDEVQGYHFARPMPADEFATFIFKSLNP